MSRGTLRSLACLALGLCAFVLLGPLAAAVVVLAAIPAVVRTQDGRLWWSAIADRLRFRWRSLRGHTVHDPAAGRPGPLSHVTLVDLESTAALAAPGSLTFLIDADGLPAETWLSLLEAETPAISVSVTSMVGSSLPPRLSIAPDAATLAGQTLRDCLPPAARLPTRWVAATWRTGDDPAGVLLAAQQTLNGLPTLAARDLAAVVHRCFDPHDDLVEDWTHVGPVAAHEFRDRYEHDGHTSLAWRLTSPTGADGALLASQPDVPVHRLTRTYQREATGQLLESAILTITCPGSDPERIAAAARSIRQAARTASATISPSGVATGRTFIEGLGVTFDPGAAKRGLRVDPDQVDLRWPRAETVDAVPIGVDAADGLVTCLDPVAPTPHRVAVTGDSAALVRRWLLGRVALGSRPVVLGDADGGCVRTVTAIQGQVITVGRGHDSINLLDSPHHRTAVLTALLTSAGKQSLTPAERRSLTGALETVATEERTVLLWHVQAALQQRPGTTRLTHLLGSILHHYGDLLDRPTSVKIDPDAPAVCIQISAEHHRDPFLLAALTTACWAVNDVVDGTFRVLCGVSAVTDAGMFTADLSEVTAPAPSALIASTAEVTSRVEACLTVTAEPGMLTIDGPGASRRRVRFTPTATEQALARGEVVSEDLFVPSAWVTADAMVDVQRVPAFVATRTAESAAAATPQTASSGSVPPTDNTSIPQASIRLLDSEPPPPGGRRGLFVAGAIAALVAVSALTIAMLRVTTPTPTPVRAGQGAQVFAASPLAPAPVAGLGVSAAKPPPVAATLAVATPVTAQPAASLLISAPLSPVVAGGLSVTAGVPSRPSGHLMIAAPVAPRIGGGVAAAGVVRPRLGASLVAAHGTPAAVQRLGANLAAAVDKPTPAFRLGLQTVVWPAAAAWQRTADYVPPTLTTTQFAADPAPAPAPGFPAAPVVPATPPAPPSSGGDPLPPGPQPPNQPFNPQNPDSQP